MHALYGMLPFVGSSFFYSSCRLCDSCADASYMSFKIGVFSTGRLKVTKMLAAPSLASRVGINLLRIGSELRFRPSPPPALSLPLCGPLETQPMFLPEPERLQNVTQDSPCGAPDPISEGLRSDRKALNVSRHKHLIRPLAHRSDGRAGKTCSGMGPSDRHLHHFPREET